MGQYNLSGFRLVQVSVSKREKKRKDFTHVNSNYDTFVLPLLHSSFPQISKYLGDSKEAES